MLDSELDAAEQSQPTRVWTKALRYLRPQDADLIRVATYTFRSLVARHWQVGRMLLAGDAAHQMPPFLGQGMCSGIRDAQNIAFKLDMVLRGHDPDLLQTYQAERDPHVRAVIERGIELGRVQTLRDPMIAEERDRRLMAERAEKREPEKIRLPGITEGFFAAASSPGRGDLSVQGFVDDGTGRVRLDTAVGHGFHLLVSAELLSTLERDQTFAKLRSIGVSVVGVADRPGIRNSVVDLDGTYRQWFDEYGCLAIAVRPDFYIYGTAAEPADVVTLATDLLAALDHSEHEPPDQAEGMWPSSSEIDFVVASSSADTPLTTSGDE